MIPYQIRKLQSADWDLLRIVRLRALADSPDAFSTRLAEDQALGESEWRSRAGDESVAQYLAISPDGTGLGMAVGARHTGYEKAAGLFGMWVAPEVRGRGIGRSLVMAVVDWARQAGYVRILLDVGDANAAAIRLYDGCGFQPTGMTGSLPPPREHVSEHERVLQLIRDETDKFLPGCSGA